MTLPMNDDTLPQDDPFRPGVYDMDDIEINGDRIVCVDGFPLDGKGHTECEPWGTVDKWAAWVTGGME